MTKAHKRSKILRGYRVTMEKDLGGVLWVRIFVKGIDTAYAMLVIPAVEE